MAEAAECIRQTRLESGYLIDPHTACGVVAAEKVLPRGEVPQVILSTAHPAKFPDALEEITGVRPALPARLHTLLTDPERFTVLPNDLAAVRRFVAERAGVSSGAAT